MEIINYEKLQEILSQNIDVEIVLDDKKATLSQDNEYDFDENTMTHSETFKGYKLDIFSKAPPITPCDPFESCGDEEMDEALKSAYKDNYYYTSQNLLDLIEILIIESFIKDENNIIVNKFGRDFDTYQDYLDEQKFANFNMREILEYYEDTADCFSLTTSFNDGYSRLRKHGKYNLSKDLGDKVIKSLWEYCIAQAKRIYENLEIEEKSKLPDTFEELIEEIQNEYAVMKKKNKKREFFFADKFMLGKTKYSKIEALYSVYSDIGRYYDLCEDVNAMEKNKKVRPIDYIFDNEKVRDLKPYLLKSEVTYNTHCNLTSILCVVHYIRLNEITKKWLLQFNDCYSFDCMEDLALYKGDKLLFSSCQHEKFQNDYSKSNK